MHGRVDAVVVNHDAGASLRGCVASLWHAGIDSVIVVDNASSDRSIEELAAVDGRAEIVASARNLGYGAGINLGAGRTDAPYLLVCNPDLVVEPEAVRALLEALERDEEIALCGPQIRDEYGAVYPSARKIPSFVTALGHAFLAPIWPTNPFSRGYRLEDQPEDTERDSDWVSGACMLVRRLAFDSVGGFDEGYFMYVEDLDLCWRLGRAGWRVRYVPSAQVMHAQGVSTSRHPYRMQLAHHRSTWRFAQRSTQGRERLLLPLVAVALVVRLVAMFLHEKAHEKERVGSTLRASRPD